MKQRINISELPGLYLHIPFCQHKCGYCDFYSSTRIDAKSDFVQALLHEITQRGRSIPVKTVFDTVYIGGGTPSLLTLAEFERILGTVRNHFRLSEDCEITVEINPGTADGEKLYGLKALGVNRLSIGVQSFHAHELNLMERIHDPEQAVRVFHLARQAGFSNISIDLIYALPGQSLSDWQQNLSQAVALHPEHISAYNLTFEPGTPFYRRMKQGLLKQISPEKETQFFERTYEYLKAHGYIAYEVSNFALSPIYYSRHNYKYWQHAWYLGFGPSAHSFWNGKRWANVSSLPTYIQGIENRGEAVAFSESIDPITREREYIFLSLRTYQGLDTRRFAREFQKKFEQNYKSVIDEVTRQGYAYLRDGRFQLTEKGMLLCDEIIPMFF